MLKDDLEALVNDLADLPEGKIDGTSSNRLYSDVFNQYYLQYELLGTIYRQAWDWSIAQRLKWIMRQYAVPAGELLTKYAGKFERYGGVTRIHFGQLRAANTFQPSETKNSIKELLGRTLQDAGMMIAQGDIPRDYMPVQIFYHIGDAVWVAINNRGFAAHCLAGAVPLRLFPRPATKEENNRLAETAALRAVDERDRLESDVRRFAREGVDLPAAGNTLLEATTSLAGRRLPSPLLPLTRGPNDLGVLGVVQSFMP